MAVQTRSRSRSQKITEKEAGTYVNTLVQANIYEALQRYSRDNGFTDQTAVRIAIAMLLRNAGYLNNDSKTQKQK